MPTSNLNATRNYPSVNLEQFADIIEKIYKNSFLQPDRPFELVPNIHCYGKPGIGKTSMLATLAHKLGINFKNVRLGNICLADFMGNPYNEQLPSGLLRQAYSAPNLLPIEERDGIAGILLLDEFKQASPTLRSQCQQLLDSRCVGDYELPSNWIIITASNEREHGAQVTELTPPVNSRALHYNILEDAEVTLRYMHRCGNFHPLILAFLTENPSRCFRDPRNGERAFPNSRTWEMASTLQWCGIDEISSAIGTAMAADYTIFIQWRDRLPDWKQVATQGHKYFWAYAKENTKTMNPSLAYITTIMVTSLINEKNMSNMVWFIEEYLSIHFLSLLINTYQRKIIYIDSLQADKTYSLLDQFTQIKLRKSNQLVHQLFESNTKDSVMIDKE